MSDHGTGDPAMNTSIKRQYSQEGRKYGLTTNA